MNTPRLHSYGSDLLLHFDPGFNRLRMALRGTLSVVISFFLLAYIFRQGNQSVTLALAGVTLTMIASLAVNDETTRQQKLTTLWLPVPAALFLSIGLLLKSWPAFSVGGFLVVIFGAMYVRRFGPRWNALGLVGFMGYFYSIFFPIPLSALGWVLFSVFLGIGMFYLVRFFLLPERPRLQLGWLVRGYRVRAGALLERANGALRFGVLPQQREALRGYFLQVNEAALLIEDILKDKRANPEGRRLLATNSWVFELEFSLRRFIETAFALASVEGLPAAHRAYLESLLNSAGEALLLAPPGAAAGRAVAIPVQALPEDAANLFENVLAEYERLRDLARGPESSTLLSEELPESKPEAPAPEPAGRMHKLTRQAIQVTLAAGMASLLGTLVSPDRWYWAPFTAYIVFAGATRGDTILRAVQRVSGTVCGLLAGFALAYVFSGNRNVEGVLVFVCIFFGLYYARKSPPITVFWFTALLAVFYQLMGTLSTELLFLRLEETLVGALAGTLMAAWVFPNSTRAAVREALLPLLRRVAEALEEAATLNPTRSARSLLFRKMRLLDRDLATLRAASAPMMGKIVVNAAPATYRRLHDASALVHYARHLVFSAAAEGSLVGKVDCQDRCLALAARIRELATRLAQEGEVVREKAVSGWTVELSPVGATRGALPHWISRMEQLVKSLAG